MTKIHDQMSFTFEEFRIVSEIFMCHNFFNFLIFQSRYTVLLKSNYNLVKYPK